LPSNSEGINSVFLPATAEYLHGNRSVTNTK
jgi:hypothetical protein